MGCSRAEAANHMACLKISQNAGVRAIIGKDKMITAAELGRAP
jgi:hypothetical protein